MFVFSSVQKIKENYVYAFVFFMICLLFLGCEAGTVQMNDESIIAINREPEKYTVAAVPTPAPITFRTDFQSGSSGAYSTKISDPVDLESFNIKMRLCRYLNEDQTRYDSYCLVSVMLSGENNSTRIIFRNHTRDYSSVSDYINNPYDNGNFFYYYYYAKYTAPAGQRINRVIIQAQAGNPPKDSLVYKQNAAWFANAQIDYLP